MSPVRRCSAAVAVLMMSLAALAGCETTSSVDTAVETVGTPALKAASPGPVEFPQLTCAAYGEPHGNTAKLTASRVKPGDPYYIEFRERDARNIGTGHTYVVFGALDKNGKPLTRQYIGLFPRGDAVGFAAGALVPVPAQLTPERDDCFVKPAVAYRVSLTREQYQALLAKVRAKLAHPPRWDMIIYNCNHFATELGEVANLKRPLAFLLPANAYMHAYIDLNETSADAGSSG
jgi:hypothetical protein